MTQKSAAAYRTISEVSRLIGVPAHTLRYWESQFAQLKPVKRGGNRRYYRPDDIALLTGIQHLLYEENLTIADARRRVRSDGVRRIAALGNIPAEIATSIRADHSPEPEHYSTEDSPRKGDIAEVVAPAPEAATTPLDLPLLEPETAKPAPEPSAVQAHPAAARDVAARLAALRDRMAAASET